MAGAGRNDKGTESRQIVRISDWNAIRIRLQWVTFDLNASPVPVNGGEVFSVLLTSDQSYFSQAYYEWLVNIALPVGYYPRGAGWQRNNNLDPWFNSPATEDYWFRTYVSPVPEPSAFALLGVSSFVWLGRRFNRSNSGGR
jgi:hypothetical protein